MSDTLDKQVKIELLINAIEAMKSIDGVADKLAKVKSAYSTPTGNNGGFGEVAAGVEQVGKAADETKEKFKTFQRQLSELKLEAQKAFRGEEATRGLNEISKEIMSVSKDFLSFRKSISDVSASSEKGFWEKVVRGLPETSAAFKEAEVNIKSLAREIDRIKEISKKPVVEKPVKIVEPKELDELTTLRNMLRDLENQKIRYNDTKNPYMAEQVQKQIDQLNGLRKAVQDTSKETEKLNTKGNVFDTYKKSISEAEIKAQQFFRIWKQTGDLNAKRNFEDIVPVIEKLNRESVEFYKKVGINSGRGFYDLGHSLDYFMAKFRSHMNWIATGMVLDSVLTLPDQMLEAMKKIEVGMAGMIQTLPQLHGNQKAVNDLTREFLGLSAQYGEKIENTIEAAKLWSRAYKDQATVMSLLHSSAVLAVADNFSMTEANKALEATMAQLGWRAKDSNEAMMYSMRIVDSWTNVAHNAQVSAQDLALANERTASVARMVGVEFDFLQAMIAAGVRNTGRSGAEVGNMLKSVFGSIHSDKAVEEIEKIGVSMFQVGENGQKEFRKVQDVLLELSVAANGTSKNMEEVLKSAAGGKFQWSKFASALDYQELVRTMTLSIESAGVAERQVAAQLDTIARKTEAITANIQQLIMTTGNAGLSNYIKSWLDDINNFLKGLQQIPSEVYSIIGTMAKWGAGIYIVIATLKLLNTSLVQLSAAKTTDTAVTVANTVATSANAGANVENTVATEANVIAKQARTAATIEATAAETGLGVATTAATGGLNLVLIALIAATTGIAMYATGVGSAAGEMEKLKQKQDALISQKGVEAETYKQRAEAVETLANAYNNIQSRLPSLSEDSEQYANMEKNLATTEEALISVLGGSTEAEREVGKAKLETMKASGMSKEAIDIEKRAFLDHSAALQSEIKVLLHDQAIYTDTQIQGVQDRIDSLAIEGEAWYKYSQIVKKAMETWAWAMDKQIAGKKILYNNMPSFMNDQKSKLGESLQEDIDFRESLRGASVEPLNEVINKYKNELSELKVKRNNLLLQSVKGLGFNSEGGLGGSEVGDDDKKKKNGSTGRASTPSTEPIQRALLNREVDHSFEEAKKSANAYEEALANVKHQEDIYGTSATSFAKSLQIKKDRYFELGKELEGYEALSNKYLAAVDNATVGSEDFLNKFSITAEQWAAMTKEQKKSFMSAYSEQNQEMKTTIQLLDLLDKVEVKVSEVRKKRSSLNNEVEMDSIVNIHKVYQEKMNTLEADKDHDIASLGYNAPQLAKNVKEYRYAVDELTLAEAELTRMEKEGLVDTETWQRQRAEVDKLKLKVQELGDRWQGIRQATADTFIDMAINGNSFKDIWKKLWADLAKEAIYRLLQVKTQASLLGSIFNLLGPKAGVIGSAEMAEIDVAAANVPLEIMHSGGVVGGSNPVVPYLKSDEVNRTLQVGEEVNSIKDRRTTEIMADQNKYLMDKLESVSQNGQPVQFTIVTPDTGSFAEYLRQHGDVLVNILREQGGLRNNT